MQRLFSTVRRCGCGLGERDRAAGILDGFASSAPKTPSAKYWTAKGLMVEALLPPIGDIDAADAPQNSQQAALERASRLFVEVLDSKDRAWTGSARVGLGELQFRVYGEAAGYPSGERQLQRALKENGDFEAALLTLYHLRRSNMQLDGAKTGRLLQRCVRTEPAFRRREGRTRGAGDR